jgi:hypothetical protein
VKKYFGILVKLFFRFPFKQTPYGFVLHGPGKYFCKRHPVFFKSGLVSRIGWFRRGRVIRFLLVPAGTRKNAMAKAIAMNRNEMVFMKSKVK